MLYKPKTLVILTPGFPKDESDTTCLPLQQALIKAIKKHYPEINLLILSFQYPFKKRSYTWCGVPVEAFGGRGRGKLMRVYNWAKVWLALKKIRKNKEVIGLLSFWLGECAFIAEQFARLYHLKHYCWILGQDAKPGNRYCTMANMSGSSLLALSDFLAGNMYINYGVMPQYVIPGGIDETMFRNGNKERHIDVLAAGSLIPLKQYHLFIEVICRLRHQFPHIKAVLCGDGPDKQRLMQMIKRLKMEDHITLVGEIPHDEVLDLMQQSKVFLHTSNYEGLGMVCLEALYAGAKVISFVRPMDDAIPNWHVTENTYCMAGIAASILSNPRVRYHAVAPYKIAGIAGQIMQLYVPKPAVTSLKRDAIALKESVDW
jgi:glycosyltransferase involved in cell wall biosynthesis